MMMEMLLAFTSTAATSVVVPLEGAARVMQGKHQYRETGKAEQKKLSQLAVWGHALSQRDPEQSLFEFGGKATAFQYGRCSD